MARTHRVFIPAARLEEFFAPVRAVLSERGVPLRLGRLRPRLELPELACFDLRVAGSVWRGRAPYVFPLMATMEDMSYPQEDGTPLECLPGVDWVVLGGDPAQFSLALGQASSICRHEAVELTPYFEVAGPLPRQRQESDVTVRLRKKWYFVNHAAVTSHLDQLLALPEERWHETGYVAVQDHFETFRPYIEARLVREPRVIVELGCGLGQTARSLALRFPEARVVGLDVSRESLRVAREKFSLPNLEFRECNFADPFAFDDGSVDLAVSSSALNISDNQAGTADETFRILSPGGLLVNGCIFEAFHSYWDFPQSAFTPTRSNLFLADWLAAAQRRELGMELHHWTRAISTHYFASGRLAAFEGAFSRWQEGVRHEPFVPYDYAQCTGFMVAGGSVATPEDLKVPPAHHLDAMEDILAACERLDRAGRELTDMTWLTVASCTGLFPEAVGFLAACLPRAAGVIQGALDTNLLQYIRPQAA
ncbi:class I SAM-dependent methyltransferase [Fundidesulfovibrio terrae]|uniref:class I SAM-dependent methyltransferase n=1 Tax=Fundidesulfovibrio terrae TaxID=2922866 RepID=UPI001FB00F0C|nr:class I SAM-dependent methyltransferase [Fundidesulfovibrio terrae]